MTRVAIASAIAVLVVCLSTPTVRGDACTGEFELCPGSHECVLFSEFCGRCTAGQYLCPDGVTCVDGAAGYLQCPNLKGTHFDWSLPIEQRLDYLVNAATTDEMIAQLTNDAPALARLGIPSYNWLNDDVHSVMGPHATVFPDGCGLGPTWDTELIEQVGQAVAIEARGDHNGYVHAGNRGHGQNGKGITMYGPNMNLVRDPRWGRSQEVYSEDPHLSSELTVNFVNGGHNMDGPYMLAGACCKHFAAYDVESDPAERYVFSAGVDTRNMWETYLPVFRACVNRGSAMHVMCSYNAINGVPTCAEPRLLNGILREQWNWDGFVVSDYDAWAQIYETHAYCPDYTCAAAAGINAGMDQEGGGTKAIEHMDDAIDAGTVANATVGMAFRRLMRARIKLGMFDPPTLVPWNIITNDTSNVESAQHFALARLAAQESMCLYKNDDVINAETNEPTPALPLSPTAPLNIALIGPAIPQEDLILGNYDQYPDTGVASILEAILRTTGENNTAQCTFENDVDYFQSGQTGVPVFGPTQCCYLCSVNATCAYWTFYEGLCYLKTSDAGRVTSAGRVSGTAQHGRIQYQNGCNDITCADTSAIPAAASLAASSDVVIVAVGLSQDIESEGHDRSTIALPQGQYDMVSAVRAAVRATGKSIPVIGVFVHGGTFALNSLWTDLDAIVDAWYPGSQGGYAIADVLFGAVSPGGRTAVTWYADDSQLPAAGQMDLYPTANNGTSLGLTYRYYTGEPTLPFGYGLSYTTFEYSNFKVVNGSNGAFNPCDVIGLEVTVTNTGSFTGDEVVQVYVKQPEATVSVPSIRLAAFKRVTGLAPGASKTVKLSVWPEFHSAVYPETVDNIYDSNAVYVEKGSILLYVGGGQPQYFKGAIDAVVSIQSTAKLNSCF